MSNVTAKVSLVALALCLAGPAGAFQTEPVRYWVPGGPFGFGGGESDAAGADSYSNVPGFDAGAASDWKANFRTGSFARAESGNVGGLGNLGAFGQLGSLSYQGGLAGYNFKGAGNLPMTFYAGFDTLKLNPGFGGPLAPFSTDSGVAVGTTARAGFAIQPAPNVSLSFEAGFTQQNAGRIDSDIHSPLLPGQSPLFVGGYR